MPYYLDFLFIKLIMTQERKVKMDLFLASTILFIFIAVFGWISAFSKFEGTFGTGIFVNFLPNTIIYFFPLVLLVDLFKIFNPAILIFLLVANIFLYSFLISKICFKLFVKTKRYRPFLATYYLTISLLMIMLANIIKFIIINS